MTRTLQAMLVALAVSLSTTVAHAQSAGSNGPNDADQTYFDYQVDQSVKVRAGRPPVYPERLRAMNVDGQVLVQFVVDERGTAQMSTFKVIRSTDAEFSDAVRRAVASTAYTPAEVKGHQVKQLVQQPFSFSARKQ